MSSGTEVATAQAQLRRARAIGLSARAETLPSLGLSASAQRARPAGASSSSDLFQAGFDASWEPDLWGGLAHADAAAQADTRAA